MTSSAANSAVPPPPWHPASWRERAILQVPAYRDAARADRVMAELRGLPPLVTSWEVEALREQLAAAQAGRAFVLQGGDCAESFRDCNSDPSSPSSRSCCR
jgi:3-deoxy-7-phosphoheptulonate synthase